MSNFRFLIVVLGMWSWSAHADEVSVPEFSEPPVTYTLKIDGIIYGKLLVGDRTKENLKFWVNVEGGNHHQCYAAGTATSHDNETYIFSNIQLLGNKTYKCVLQLILVEHSAVLLDDSWECHALYCGARADFHGSIFHAEE